MALPYTKRSMGEHGSACVDYSLAQKRQAADGLLLPDLCPPAPQIAGHTRCGRNHHQICNSVLHCIVIHLYLHFVKDDWACWKVAGRAGMYVSVFVCGGEGRGSRVPCLVDPFDILNLLKQ